MALLAVLGPTGFTGRLVCARARRLGLSLRLVGRRREALDELAEPGEEVCVADARDSRALREAFEGASVVASCAGPFLEVGWAPVQAAVSVGVHYLDTSGEQDFARRVYDEYDMPARSRGVVLLTSFGFDYVVGDLAARLAADGLEPLDRLLVGYVVEPGPSSRGTRRTVARGARLRTWSLVEGRLVPTRLGATTHRFALPEGPVELIEFAGGEPLTVPRHTSVNEVRSYLYVGRVGRRLVRLARLLSPALEVAARFGADPDEAARSAKGFQVVAEARGRAGARTVTLAGRDTYVLTAQLIARGVAALDAGQVDGSGALAPAEAFDAETLLDFLEPSVVVSESTHA